MRFQRPLLLVPLCLVVAGAWACSGTSSNGISDDGGGGGTGGSSGSNAGSGSGANGSSGAHGSSGSPGGSSSGSGSGSIGSSSGSHTGSSSGSNGSSSGSSSGSPGGSSSGTSSGGPVGTGIFANCTVAGGCVADCSAPANDPLASPTPDQYDIYDGCIIAGLAAAGFTQTWQGQLLKAEAITEGGTIVSSVDTDIMNNPCGGQNCGMIAISGGKVSGDNPPGPCGVSATDPFTGMTDYSHSYGLFQDTPACEGTFLLPSLPSGYTCTGTTTNDLVPFSSTQTAFYCETATSQGVTGLSGSMVSGYIDAVTDPNDPYYKLSVFNPAYNLFVHLGFSLPIEYQQANAGASGCTQYQQFYNTLAYWLVGDPITGCALSGKGLQYVQTTLSNYQTVYGQPWPYDAP